MSHRLEVGLCPALTEEVLKKLKGAGIKNIIDFMLKDSEDLAMESTVNYKDLQSIRRIIHAYHSAFTLSGDELLTDAISTAASISTGNEGLDKILGGGLMTGEVVELCGNWGVGKTSICVSIACHAALKLCISSLYIDLNGGVSPHRMIPILESMVHHNGEQAAENALSLIKVVSPIDIWAFFQALEIPKKCVFVENGIGNQKQINTGSEKVNQGKIKLVIIDSLTTLLTPITTGSQKQGWGIINQVAQSVKLLAGEHHLAVLLVNSVFQEKTPLGNFNSRPALGRFWGHMPHTRLLIEEIPSPNFSALPTKDIFVTVCKSNRVKPGKTKAQILFNEVQHLNALDA